MNGHALQELQVLRDFDNWSAGCLDNRALWQVLDEAPHDDETNPEMIREKT